MQLASPGQAMTVQVDSLLGPQIDFNRLFCS